MLLPVPVRQHEGVYKKDTTIPNIMFRLNSIFLRDNEDLLSLITDFAEIAGKFSHILGPLGYKNIPIDLKQTLSSFKGLQMLIIFISEIKQIKTSMYMGEIYLLLNELSDLNLL